MIASIADALKDCQSAQGLSIRSRIADVLPAGEATTQATTALNDRAASPALDTSKGTAAALEGSRPQGSPRVSRLERLVLLEHVLGRPREWLIAHAEDPLGLEEGMRFQALLARREVGEPIAYLVGHREFFGLRLQVDEGVLIPRPETELLVETALSHAPRNSTILDLGTGSGAIAIALANARHDLEVWASDLCPRALALAQANAFQLLAARPCPVRWFCANWWDGLPTSRLDLVLANPPYLAADDPHLHQGDLRFEPLVALSDGHDGLRSIEAVLAGFAQRAIKGLIGDPGLLLVEHGASQSAQVRRIGETLCLRVQGTLCDLSGHPRVSVFSAP